MIDKVREFKPWEKPRADGKHSISFLIGFRAVLAIPIQHYDAVLGGLYCVAVLLLREDGDHEIRDRSSGLLEILAGREQDNLPLSDPAKLEMLVGVLSSISSNSTAYRLYRNTATRRVVIVREEGEIGEGATEKPEKRPAGIAAWSVERFNECLARGHHRFEGRILVNNRGGQPYELMVCTDCRVTIAAMQVIPGK